MGHKKLTDVDKSCTLTLLELGTTVLLVTAKLKVSRQAIYNLKKASANLPPGVVPKRKADAHGSPPA